MIIETVDIQRNGYFKVNGATFVANESGAAGYQEVQDWIDQGNVPAPYFEPPKAPEQIRDEDLQSIVLDLDGDGVRVIQCRPAKFAQDESNMRNAIEKMQRDAVTNRLWFMADDTAHLVTVADLEASIVSGQDQASDIWDQFFLTIQE